MRFRTRSDSCKIFRSQLQKFTKLENLKNIKTKSKKLPLSHKISGFRKYSLHFLDQYFFWFSKPPMKICTKVRRIKKLPGFVRFRTRSKSCKNFSSQLQEFAKLENFKKSHFFFRFWGPNIFYKFTRSLSTESCNRGIQMSCAIKLWSGRCCGVCMMGMIFKITILLQ